MRLIRRASNAVLALSHLSMDPQGRALAALQATCRLIADVGASLQVVKGGRVIATGWEDREFAVACNEAFDIGTRQLRPYRRRRSISHVPEALHAAHALVADELEGVIDVAMTLERALHVEMFHDDEVNEEATLFANWAYKSLHDAIIPLRHAVAISPVAWLLSLPYAVEILAQTQVDEESWTEVSTTAIYYKDWETRRIRRSFSCQFHPELMADIRDVGGRSAPRYGELKDSDGIRLLLRLLYHGMQD